MSPPRRQWVLWVGYILTFIGFAWSFAGEFDRATFNLVLGCTILILDTIERRGIP